MITAREFLLAFLLPAIVCVLCGALAARLRPGIARRGLAALALALPFLLAVYAITSYVPFAEPLGSATQLTALLVLPVALLAAVLPPAVAWLAPLALLGWFFQRLGAPPGWPERAVAALALIVAWNACRPAPEARPAWRPLLALATFAGAAAFLCICGRVASLSLVAAGLGASVGALFLATLRWPNWSPARPGFDVAVFALGGTLASAVYLGELNPWAALVLLASLASTRLPGLALGFGTQLVLVAAAIWIAWPADGFAA